MATTASGVLRALTEQFGPRLRTAWLDWLQQFARACQYRRMHAIEIRDANPDDCGAIAEYHDRCFWNTYSSQLLAGEFEAPDLEGMRQQLHEWFRPDPSSRRR